MNILEKITIVFVLVLISSWVMASGKHHGDITINNFYEIPEPPPGSNVMDPGTVTYISVTSGVSDSDLAKAIATALATGHQFDYSTTKIQASALGAYYDDQTAMSVGIAKRWKEVDALWHAAYSTNGDSKYGVVAGATWRF